MSTKELILQELGSLDDSALNEIYLFIQRYVETQQRTSSSSLMSKLKQVKIYAPPDFATNLDEYTSGEKSVE